LWNQKLTRMAAARMHFGEVWSMLLLRSAETTFEELAQNGVRRGRVPSLFGGARGTLCASMETVVCNNCGCPETLPLYKFRLDRQNQDVCVVRCSQCELVYLNPRPTKDTIGNYYPPNYQANMLDLLTKGRTSLIGRLWFGMIRRRRTPSKRVGRLLDVGCSNGAYLAAMRDIGWEVEGVEFDSDAVGYARHFHSLKVTQGDLEDALRQLPESDFDVVTMWHVLEHSFDPAAALRLIHRVLKPGGVLMLEVPNFAALSASLFRRCWYPMDVPRHLYQFTPATIKTMLTKARFHDIRVKGVPAPEAIVWSAVAARQGSPIDFNRGDSLGLNPVAMSLAFPVSWVMAQFAMSDHMTAIAVRGD
jgi:2-polyprenyl-3-methyl-5-hydroxy-6-metoxy-1,4-benzoquinol methylase